MLLLPVSSSTILFPASSFIRGAYLRASLQSRFHEITLARSSEITWKWSSVEGRRDRESTDWNSRRVCAHACTGKWLFFEGERSKRSEVGVNEKINAQSRSAWPAIPREMSPESLQFAREIRWNFCERGRNSTCAQMTIRLARRLVKRIREQLGSNYEMNKVFSKGNCEQTICLWNVFTSSMGF